MNRGLTYSNQNKDETNGTELKKIKARNEF
jgi:hypothetical protein